MKIALIIFGIGTVFFIITMIRQFGILNSANQNDPVLTSKLLFFIFNLFDVLTTIILLCAFYWHDETLLIPAAIFYTLSAIIAFWAYYKQKK